MNESTYIEQELAAGSPIHRHQGVCWQVSAPGVCKPVFPMQVVQPGDARPRWLKSFVGYSHLVPAGTQCRRTATFWLMEEPQLRTYCFENLKPEKRKAVSRARRSGLAVARIGDVEPLWSDLQSIAMSMAIRTGYGKPADYYETRFADWQASLRSEFSKPDREWWGVFAGKRLVGYQYAYLIDGTMCLRTAKVHGEYLKDHASDLLYFAMLEYCRDLPGCTRIDAGRHDDSPGVSRFKQAQGFEKREFGEYFSYNPLLEIVLRSLLCLHRRFGRDETRESAGGNGLRLRTLYQHAIMMAERVVGTAGGTASLPSYRESTYRDSSSGHENPDRTPGSLQ